MKTLKIILFLIIGLALVGCNGNNEEEDEDEDIDEIVEPSLMIEANEYTIEEESTLQLEVSVLNSDREEGIIYISSNNIVATISTTGLITAKTVGFSTITVMLSSYPNQKLEIIITVKEKPSDDILRAINDFALIKQEFSKLPDIVTNDLKLDNYLHTRLITWSSSNEEVISKYGMVYRKDKDIEVTLTARMSYKEIEEVFTKVVTVKKLELRDLSNKKISFAYSRAVVMDSNHLQKIDIINYAFASISLGTFSVSSQISTLVRNAHNNGARVVVAVGGGSAEGSNPFKDMTLTAEKRQIFITSLLASLKQLNFDGVDYDWEYPATTAEMHHFTALLKETREAFDEYKSGLILSSALSAGTWSINNRYDIKEINKYLDYFHIMTYDLNNWPANGGYALTRHHANLYRSTLAPGLSSDESIMAYINAGADPKKVIIGVAAYGRKATNITATTGNGLNVMGENPAQSIRFSEIYRLYYENPETSGFTLYYDNVAEAAWLFDGSTFISFDDERSIIAKCHYVNLHSLGGAMFWDYSMDYNGTVVGYIYNNLNK